MHGIKKFQNKKNYHPKPVKSRNGWGRGSVLTFKLGHYPGRVHIAQWPHIGYKENMSDGIIEVDLFSKDVDSADHPDARKFKRLLRDVAKEYGCRLTSFDVEHGTVSFSFDSDVLVAEILRVLKSKHEDDAG